MKIDEEVSEIILTAGKKNLHVLRVMAHAEEDPDQAQAEEAGRPHWETLEGKPVQEKEVDSLGQNAVELEV